MPCFLIESAYEHERNATTQIIRRQAYWALISGATGHMYGEKDTYAFTNTWNAALNAPGAESMHIFDAFIKSIPWYKLKPDWPHTVFTGGRGYFNPTELPGGEDYATGAVTTDSTMAILYMPTSRTVCVIWADLNRAYMPNGLIHLPEHIKACQVIFQIAMLHILLHQHATIVRVSTIGC